MTDQLLLYVPISQLVYVHVYALKVVAHLFCEDFVIINNKMLSLDK